MRGAALLGPRLGCIEERLADPGGAAGGIDREIPDPGAAAEPHGIKVQVRADDPDESAAALLR
jgi:hypothetical protein